MSNKNNRSKKHGPNRSRSTGRSKRGSNKGMQWTIIGGVLLAVLLVGVQLTANRTSEGGTPYYDDLPFSATSIGASDAPVTVVEYFDFQCPACQQASDLIVKPLITDRVDAGEVRFIYRFFPILGPESVAAAEAAYCAVLQESFWPYQEKLFSRKGTGNRGAFSRRNLIGFAKDIGLDQTQFEQCLDSREAAAYVQSSYEHAMALGLQGTPSFTVNGQYIRTNAKDINDAIDKALEEGLGREPGE